MVSHSSGSPREITADTAQPALVGFEPLTPALEPTGRVAADRVSEPVADASAEAPASAADHIAQPLADSLSLVSADSPVEAPTAASDPIAQSAAEAIPFLPDNPLAPPPTSRRARLTRLAFLALTLAAGAYAVARQWTRVRAGFADLGPLPLTVASLPALAS